LEILPTLKYHRCSGGFLDRVKKGTYFGHILEHITLELQNYTGINRGFGRTRETEISGIYKIVISADCKNFDIIKECFYCALEIMFKLIKNEEILLRNYMKRIINISDKYFGINTHEILKNIPKNIGWFKIDEDNNLFQIGYGNTMRRIWSSETNYTKGISETIAKDKYLTKKLLKNHGITVSEGILVSNLDEIYKYISDKNYNTTIKPINGNHANGVHVNIDRNNKSYIKFAFNNALKENKDGEEKIIVEKYIKGETYRITLINMKVIACCYIKSNIIKNKIIGDGKSSIKELVDDIFAIELLENSNKDYTKEKEIVILDELDYYHNYINEYLNKNGKNINTILNKNTELTIERKFDNYLQVDINNIHKETIEQCELASKIIGLDICGIDIILEDITKPLSEKNGAILEINAGPSLGLHMNNKISVGKEFIKYLFNDISLENYFFPIISIVGDGDCIFVNKFITSFFTYIGKYIRSYSSNKNKSNYEDVKLILMNRRLEMAVFDTNSKTILNEGIFYKKCNAVILGKINMVEYKSECVINEPDNTPKILRTLTTLVPKNGFAILNMDDENINELYKNFDRHVIFYSLNNYDINYRCIYYENEYICISYNHTKISLFKYERKTYEILAAIGGIWSFFDLINNISVLRNFINQMQ
jgi:cyanophycin synthetase